MKRGAPGAFGMQLRSLREAAGFTQEELATVAGLSVQAISALERGERRRPHLDTVRALSAALDLTGAAREALLGSARAPGASAAVDELSGAALPIPQTVLVGREADLSTLRAWLDDPMARLVTLVGPGGVGKTRLALELARRIAEEGGTSVRFVELAAIREAAFATQAIGDALCLSDLSADDLPRRIKVACSVERPTLLVLDNCEQVADVAPLAAAVLRSTESMRLLATSRAPLRVRGERLYPVDPLGLPADPEDGSPADLARAPAVRLFVERVRDVTPDFRLTGANGRVVSTICRRLDALPLALELAATRMRALTAEDLLRQIERDVMLSGDGPRDLPERQQTMNATVAWSYQLLDADQQRAFRRLGVLEDRFPVEAVAAVLGAPPAAEGTDGALTAIAALSDKSLLLRDPPIGGHAVYHMLETVRSYALQQVTAAGERDDALAGLARFCCQQAQMAAEGLVGPDQVGWMNRVREGLANYRTVLTWLIERGRGADAALVVSRLGFFWLIRGHAAEGLQWFDRILSSDVLPPSTEARALVTAGTLSYSRGELSRARTQLERAIALAEATGDADLVAAGHHIMGHVAHGMGDVEEAQAYFERAVAGFEALSISWGRGASLTGIAWVALAGGDSAAAERLLDDATAILRDSGPWFLSLVSYLRAVLAVRRGNADEAIALVRDNLTRIRELRDRFAFVYALVPLAAAAVLKGDDAWAARIVGARDAVTERTGATVVDDSVKDLRETAEQGASARLGPGRWTRAYEAGRRASIDALLTDIDGTRA